MKIYIVIEDNGEEYPEDFERSVGGVFSSLEEALSHEAEEGWEVNCIEVWDLNGKFIKTIDPQEEEESAPNLVADLPLTSIGGLMVRKMIEEYERKMQQQK